MVVTWAGLGSPAPGVTVTVTQGSGSGAEVVEPLVGWVVLLASEAPDP